MTEPRRGDVWWVASGPAVGGEIQKTRPAIVLSNNAANRALNRVQVVPLTTKTDRVYASEALVQLNGQTRKALADQIFTASKLRFQRQAGSLSGEDLAAVERVVRLQLGL